MTTLAVNTPRDKVIGDYNDIPVIAADIIYEGAAVGIVKSSGHAQPLTSSDIFAGFADEKADNSAGAAAAINVRVMRKGCVKLAVTGALITDVGLPVYASDDNAFSFIKTSGVFIGYAKRFVSSGYMEVAFDVDGFVDPHDGLLAQTVSDDLTTDEQDTGKVLFVDTDAKTITLAAVLGGRVRIVNAGGFGTVAVTVSPNANDGIGAANMTSVDNKDIVNTKATACRGDYIDLEYGDADGWVVTKMRGTWAKEA